MSDQTRAVLRHIILALWLLLQNASNYDRRVVDELNAAGRKLEETP